MADSTVRDTEIDDSEEPTDGAQLSERRLRISLRDSDRAGALSESQAALDVAFANGYAHGLEQAREEDLEALRTILLRWLEARFGEVTAPTLDKIASASWVMLERWLLHVHEAASIEQALAG